MVTLKLIIEVIKKEWVTVIFSILFLAAWTANAFKTASFDLGQLTLFYTTVRGAFLVGYITDSTANSPKGEHPYPVPNKNEPKDGC